MEIIPIIYERPAIEVLQGISAYFKRVLLRKEESRSAPDWRARKIKEFLDIHPLHCGHKLDDICRQLGLAMSGRQARRVFKIAVGIGVRDYAKKSSLQLAIKQLGNTNIPVKVIAADLGYQSTRQFRRRFKQCFGLSPLELRRVSFCRAMLRGKP